jgi:hypothetical protein
LSSASGSNNCSFLRESRFDGKGFVRTGATAPVFSYLREIETGNEGLVDQTCASSNPLISWLRCIDGLWHTA